MTHQERRVIVFLRRKPGLSRAGFLRHWGEVHGPLVAGRPEFWTHTARYVQNHLADPGTEPFDGIAVSTQAAPADSGAGFPGEPCYLSVIRPDEERFLDLGAIVRIHATAHVLRDGAPGGAKLIALVGGEMLTVIRERLPVDAHRLVVNRFENGTDALRDGSGALSAVAMIEIWGEDTRSLRRDITLSCPVAPVLAFAVTERSIEQPQAAQLRAPGRSPSA